MSGSKKGGNYPLYYTLNEVSDYWGVSYKSLVRWIHAGRLKARKRLLWGISRPIWSVTPAQFSQIPRMMEKMGERVAPGLKPLNDKARKGMIERKQWELEEYGRVSRDGELSRGRDGGERLEKGAGGPKKVSASQDDSQGE